MGSVVLNGATSGATTITPTDAVTVSLTLPSTTGTLGLASGSATQSINAQNTFGFKNRIINGNMVINQRYGTTLQTGASGFVTDRFQVLNSSAGTVNAQTVTTAPAGFTYSTQLTVGTADTAVGSSDSVMFYQTLEGYNIADLNWGTANAKTVTLSFWVYSSLVGTYSGSLVDQAGNYSFPFNYTISSANTWEQKSVTITGPTSGTFGKVNDVGFYLEISLMTGSTYQGTPNAWAVGNFRGTASQVNWMATSGNTWQISGVQLEVGSQATSFDFRDYGRELMMCQRYYQAVSSPTGGFPYGISTAQVYAGTNVQGSLPLSCPMRATPSATQTGVHLSGGSTGTADVLLSSFGTIYYDGKSNLLGFGGTVASSQTGGYNWSLYLSSTVGYQLSAEL